MPAAIAHSMEPMLGDCSTLSTILSPQAENDTQAKRKAKRIVDNAWAAFQGWVNGWSLLPPEKIAHADQTAALRDLMFSGGLHFTQLAYKIEWQQSQSQHRAQHWASVLELGKRRLEQGIMRCLQRSLRSGARAAA